MVFDNIFNPGVVDYESKNNLSIFMTPESWSYGGFIVTGFVKTAMDKII